MRFRGRVTPAFLVISVLLGWSLRAQEISPILERIEKASDAWVYDSLLGLHQEIFEMVELEESYENRILLAIIDYWLAGYHWTKEKDSSRFYLEELVRTMEGVPEEEREAEEWAFLGYAYSTLIPLRSFVSAPLLGRKSGKAYQKALELKGDSPIVNLLRGISLFYTPKVFGGGADKALVTLSTSIELYERNPGPIPWGKKVALLHKARALRESERNDEALEILKKTLSEYPDFGWARSTMESWKGEQQ